MEFSFQILLAALNLQKKTKMERKQELETSFIITLKNSALQKMHPRLQE